MGLNMRIKQYQMSGLVNKNTIHHFGDSYATSGLATHFVNLIANDIGINYCNYAKIGDSNELIFQKILEKYNIFKKGDIVFINFSFVNRGCYYDYTLNKVMPSNNFYTEIYDDIQYKWLESVNEKEKINLLFDYYLKYDDDYNRRIFYLINTFLKSLIDEKEIKLYYIFIDNPTYINELLTVGTNINFENGFGKWLLSKKWHENENCHYTMGIQPELANIVLDKVSKFRTSII
jgi:hypothetical protein